MGKVGMVGKVGSLSESISEQRIKTDATEQKGFSAFGFAVLQRIAHRFHLLKKSVANLNFKVLNLLYSSSKFYEAVR
jgi:hypothetical protein